MAAPGPATPTPSDWLRVADDLARQGQFGEAIHVLLIGVLGTIRPVDGQASAWTGREIARHHVGVHAERLWALVKASELVHFGGRPATREQFDDCRRDAAELENAAGAAPA